MNDGIFKNIIKNWDTLIEKKLVSESELFPAGSEFSDKYDRGEMPLPTKYHSESINEIISKILNEWSWRVKDGSPDYNNPNHYLHLLDAINESKLNWVLEDDDIDTIKKKKQDEMGLTHTAFNHYQDEQGNHFEWKEDISDFIKSSDPADDVRKATDAEDEKNGDNKQDDESDDESSGPSHNIFGVKKGEEKFVFDKEKLNKKLGFYDRNKIDVNNLNFLGSGDFGEAYSTGDGRVVKTTSSKVEYKLAKDILNHGNIGALDGFVDFYDADIVDGKMVIVMEELGEDLPDGTNIEDLYYELSDLLDEVQLPVQYIDHLDTDELDISENLDKFIYDMMDINHSYRYLGVEASDIKSDNLGVDKNGKIKAFDIHDKLMKDSDISDDYFNSGEPEKKSFSTEGMNIQFTDRKISDDLISTYFNRSNIQKPLVSRDLIEMTGIGSMLNVDGVNPENINIDISHEEDPDTFDMRFNVNIIANNTSDSLAGTISRSIIIDHKTGEVSIYNDGIDLYDTPKGTGSNIFHDQVKSSIKNGISKIECFAAGNRNDSYNGYYTWARLGFEAKSNNEFRYAKEDLILKLKNGMVKKEYDKLKDEYLKHNDTVTDTYSVTIWDIAKRNVQKKGIPDFIQNSNSFKDIMKTPESREIWMEYGSEFDAKFDLKDKSQLEYLEKYIKELNENKNKNENINEYIEDKNMNNDKMKKRKLVEEIPWEEDDNEAIDKAMKAYYDYEKLKEYKKRHQINKK